MTIRELLGQWVQANRDFIKQQQDRRAVTYQQSYKTSELYPATHQQYDPCFVLSTGRCGTKLLTKILQAHPSVAAFHEPVPELYYYAGYAYRHHQQRHEELKAVIDCARYQLIRDSFILGRKYVETNNRITFFAYQLAELYPKSKFIHLLRNPLSFVRSGYSRDWYSDRVITDEARIQPVDAQREAWKAYSQVGKIAWLWNETNRFIHDFTATLLGDRVLTIRSEDFFSDPLVSKAIFAFIGVESLPVGKLRRLLKKPVNRQSTIKRLSEAQKAEVVAIATLADQAFFLK